MKTQVRVKTLSIDGRELGARNDRVIRISDLANGEREQEHEADRRQI